MHPASEKVLHNLLEQPFGPYLEETILSDKCKFVPTKRLLLEDFQLAYNNEPTGFDRTEFDGDSVPSNVAHLAPIQSGSRVLFRGVLSVHALAHLSEKGVQYLNHDYNERATNSVLNGVFNARKCASMDLESIFASNAKQKDILGAKKYHIRVLIQGYMHSTASFMRSDLAPNGLLFHAANSAKNRFRIYEIVSMDVETYKLSRTFLFRYHTLRTMRDILKREDGVPAHKCTPQWFLEHYLRCAYPPYSRWQRISSLDDVESSDEGSTIHRGQIFVPHPDFQTQRPRHLRTIHRNEVWSIFASHCEWILSLVEKHKDLKGKVNTQSWRNFSKQVPQLRQRAMPDKNTDGEWGLRDEQGGSPIGNISVPSLSVSKAISQPKTSKGQKNKKKSPSVKPIIHSTHAPLASSSLASVTISQVEDQPDNIYDSDFTQGSPSPTSYHASPWPLYSAAVHTHPTSNPSLYALIPHEMLVPPTLPVNMVWHCPVGGTCSYVIDLCAPSDDNLRLISAVVPQDDITYLHEKDWKTNDEQVHMIFYEIVNAHWENHLKELDIRYVQQGDDSTFEWIHPQRHEPWPPQRWNRMRAHRHSSSQSQKETRNYQSVDPHSVP